MMKHLTVFIVLNIFLFNVSGQTTFQKTFGGSQEDHGYSVQQTTDNGFVIAGTTKSFGAGNFDYYVIKTNANGDTLWTKTYGGLNTDYGYSIQQTSDGGYIIVGYSNTFGGLKGYLIKTNSVGGVLWSKTYSGWSDETITVKQTIDGGYIIAGSTDNLGVGDQDMYVIKTDASGNIVWSKTYGGQDFDYANSVQQTSDGGYIIVGKTNSFSFSASYHDFYLVKTDANGNLLWSKVYGGADSEIGYGVQQTSDGGYILAGATDSFGSGIQDNSCLIKTDSVGNLVWTKMYGGTGNEEALAVQQTPDGGYVMVGFSWSFGAANSDCYMIKTDANGDTLWCRAYEKPLFDALFSVQQTSDGGYIAGGRTYNPIGLNVTYEFILIKTDANGSSGCSENSLPVVVSPGPLQDSTAMTIEVTQTPSAASPVTLEGNGTTINTICLSIGIYETTSKNNLAVYPNPTSDFLIVENITKGSLISIKDVLGREVYSEISDSETTKIHTGAFAKGCFFPLQLKNIL